MAGPNVFFIHTHACGERTPVVGGVADVVHTRAALRGAGTRDVWGIAAVVGALLLIECGGGGVSGAFSRVSGGTPFVVGATGFVVRGTGGIVGGGDGAGCPHLRKTMTGDGMPEY